MSVGCMCTNACMHLVVKDQPSVSFLRSFPFNFYLLLFSFYVCECFPLLCACSALRGRPSELQIVVGYHVVVGILWKDRQPVFLTNEPLVQPLFIYFLETRFLTEIWASQKWLGWPAS